MDGNGRIARVMMNAELTKAGQSKIIIPTVFREDYMGALKKFTKQRKCDTYIKMLQRAQEFSANVFAEQINEMQDWITHNCSSVVEINWTKEQTTPFDLVVEYLFDNSAEALAFQLKYK